MGWIQVPRVGEPEALRGWDVELKASVVVGGWANANVKTIGCVGGPGCTGCWVIINECFCS